MQQKTNSKGALLLLGTRNPLFFLSPCCGLSERLWIKSYLLEPPTFLFLSDRKKQDGESAGISFPFRPHTATVVLQVLQNVTAVAGQRPYSGWRQRLFRTTLQSQRAWLVHPIRQTQDSLIKQNTQRISIYPSEFVYWDEDFPIQCQMKPKKSAAAHFFFPHIQNSILFLASHITTLSHPSSLL